jgi:hypothetical protein
MKSVTEKRIIIMVTAKATGGRIMGSYLISISSGCVKAGIFLILPEIMAIIISPAMLGNTHIQIDPMPMSRKRPVAKSNALAVIHDAAAEKPIVTVPSSLPASQKSVTDLCRREEYRPMPASAATYIMRSTMNSK